MENWPILGRRGRLNKTPRIVAFIDIGTNSIRFLLKQIDPSGHAITLSKQKEVVRLGEGEFEQNLLRPEATQRAALVCKGFADMARANQANEIIAVATSATREARNQRKFLRQLFMEAGLRVHVISGTEEARLIYMGVSQNVNLGDRTALFVDIGGGSTELIVGDQHNFQSLDSLKLGAIRVSAEFFPLEDIGPVSSKRLEAARAHIRNTAVRSLQRIKDLNHEILVGSSGTIETLGNLITQKNYGRPLLREDVLTREQLDDVIAQLARLPLADRARLPGINPRRADIIIGGALILQELLDATAINQFIVSDRGLQDGLLVDYLRRNGYILEQPGTSVRERSVLTFARHMRIDEPHAEKVRDLALQMFDSAGEAGLHTMNESDRELLAYAAILHDVGIFLAYTNHQAHSYYLVRNADLLGFDQAEIQALASLCFFHRGKFPAKEVPQFRLLERSYRRPVRQMSILLRIAESLDRSHANTVSHARFTLSRKDTLCLEVRGNPSAQLEMWGVEKHLRSFEKAFGASLQVDLIAN